MPMHGPRDALFPLCWLERRPGSTARILAGLSDVQVMCPRLPCSKTTGSHVLQIDRGEEVYGRAYRACKRWCHRQNRRRYHYAIQGD